MIIIEPGELAKIEISETKFVFVRGLSAKQEREFAKEYDAVFEFETSAEHQDKVTALFTKHVVRWEGFGEGSDPEEVFSRSTMITVLRQLLMGKLVSAEEKKS